MEGLREELRLSKVTLGTMRFFDKNCSVNQVTALINEAFEIGIDTHHSSLEYTSYELYINGLKESNCVNKIKHIVKLSSPHFEDVDFDEINLENRVDAQLKAINIETIDVLQWLVRSKPINDHDRLKILKDQEEKIERTLETLKNKGKIKTAFSFPYSTAFADEVIKLNQVDGIVSYLNEAEKEYVKFAKNSPFIGIRPFFAAKLLENTENPRMQIKSCLDFVFKHDKVLSTITGINSVDQLKPFKEYLN